MCGTDVGRTSWSAADALVGLVGISIHFEQRDQGSRADRGVRPTSPAVRAVAAYTAGSGALPAAHQFLLDFQHPAPWRIGFYYFRTVPVDHSRQPGLREDQPHRGHCATDD